MRDVERSKKLAEQISKATESMADSDRPDNAITGGLRMIGSVQEYGNDKGFLFNKVIKPATIGVAKMRLWSDKDINEAIEEGRKQARFEISLDEDSD
jgi:hypothetical protein